MEDQLSIVLLVLLILFIIYLFIKNSNVCSIVRNNRNNRDLFTIGVPGGPSVNAMKEADENRNGHYNKYWPPAKAGETLPRTDVNKITTAQWFTTLAQKQAEAELRHSDACMSRAMKWYGEDGLDYPYTCGVLTNWNDDRNLLQGQLNQAQRGQDAAAVEAKQQALVEHLLKMINFADGQNTKRERKIGERKAQQKIGTAGAVFGPGSGSQAAPDGA